jgi:hypothetical protein
MFTIQALEGRGRGLVAQRDIKAGEVILSEEPILLTVSQEAKDAACAHCLRLLKPAGAFRRHRCFAAFAAVRAAVFRTAGNRRPSLHQHRPTLMQTVQTQPLPGAIPCQACRQVAFCSAACAAAAAAKPWVHADATCRALSALAAAPLDDEGREALRFLMQAMALRALAAHGPAGERLYTCVAAYFWQHVLTAVQQCINSLMHPRRLVAKTHHPQTNK